MRQMEFPRTAQCPCCLFPTLNDNGGFEICVICWWEDDGQNDKNAVEVRGGPNSHYSLVNARKNFIDHGHMYDKGHGIKIVEKPSAARCELINYLASIGFNPAKADATLLGKLLGAADRFARKGG